MKNKIEIISCLPGSKEFLDFLSVRSRIYSPSALTSSLQNDIESNHLVICLVAKFNEIASARVVLYDNPSVQHQQQKTFLFGYFECIEDDSLASALISAVKDAAREHGAKFLIGPVNGSTWNDYRFNLPPEAPPFFSEFFHPAYYSQLFLSSGFEVLEEYISSISGVESDDAEEVDPYFEEHQLTIRQIDLEKFEDDLKALFPFCETAFRQNPFFSALSMEDFIAKYLPLKKFLDPKFILLADGEEGITGLFFSFPDVFHPGRLVIKTVAKNITAPKGLITMMTKIIYRTAKENNYQSVIHAYMHVNNKSLILSKKFLGEIYQRHALFVNHLAHE